MQNRKKTIVVCSKNKAKNDAVIEVIKHYFDDFEIESLETNSGVSETPIGDEEGIEGCFNRIKDAIKQKKMVIYMSQWKVFYLKHHMALSFAVGQ